MSTEPEEETYEAQSVELADGSLLIADEYEFFEATQSIAVHVLEGVVYVLDAKTLTWRNTMKPPDSSVVTMGPRRPMKS